MNLPCNPRFTTLWYWAEALRAAGHPQAPPHLDRDYYAVLSWPLDEVGDSLQAIAGALVDRTLTPAWHRTLQRPANVGDILTYAPHLYMLADQPLAHHHSLSGRRIQQLDCWPRLWLIQFDWRRSPCKVSA